MTDTLTKGVGENVNYNVYYYSTWVIKNIPVQCNGSLQESQKITTQHCSSVLQLRCFPLKSCQSQVGKFQCAWLGWMSLVCDWKYLLGHLNIPSRKKDRILCAALKTFYSWSKNGGSFLDLEYLREIHQEPAQPWVGVLNKWNSMIAVCGKWVLLPKFNLHF